MHSFHFNDNWRLRILYKYTVPWSNWRIWSSVEFSSLPHKAHNMSHFLIHIWGFCYWVLPSLPHISTVTGLWPHKASCEHNSSDWQGMDYRW